MKRYDYFYGEQSEQFNFVRIPKQLIRGEEFKELSMEAKILYALFLDRMSLSRKNDWFDENNRVFIQYPVVTIMEELDVCKNTALKYLKELEEFGLIEKQKKGLGKPNRIYVKNFIHDDSMENHKEASVSKENAGSNNEHEKEMQQCEELDSSATEENFQAQILNFSGSKSEPVEAQKMDFLGADFGTSEVQKMNPNNTNINNTDYSETESNHILSAVTSPKIGYDTMRYDSLSPKEEVCAYESLIKANIDYDSLVISHADEIETIDGIVDLIKETVLSKNDTIVIASNKYPAAMVKSKLLKLNYEHIDYVLFSLGKNTSKVHNIKKYLLASLFNAPSTINGYYKAEVNYDLYGQG